MAFKLGQGFVDFFLKSDRFKTGAMAIGVIVRGLGAQLQIVAGHARNMLIAGAGIAYKLVRLSMTQIEAEAKLTAVIRATGGAAGFTAKELFKQAAALQKLTTFGDEQIINAQALLATFKEIRGVEFTRATAAMLDMAAVMGMDLAGAAVLVGKALNEPIIGMNQMKRSGVSFTQAQRDQVKVLLETGQTAAAQTVILAALEEQFKGAAEAMAKTPAGQLKQAWNALGDAGEKVGIAILDQIAKWIPKIQEFTEWVRTLTRRDIAQFIESVKTLGKWLIGVWLGAKVFAAMAAFGRAIKLISSLFVTMGGSAAAAGTAGQVAMLKVQAAAGLAALAIAAITAEYIRAQAAASAFEDRTKEAEDLFTGEDTKARNVELLEAEREYRRAMKSGTAAEQIKATERYNAALEQSVERAREQRDVMKDQQKEADSLRGNLTTLAQQAFGAATVDLGDQIANVERDLKRMASTQKNIAAQEDEANKKRREGAALLRVDADKLAAKEAAGAAAGKAGAKGIEFVGLEEMFIRRSTGGSTLEQITLARRAVELQQKAVDEQVKSREAIGELTKEVKKQNPLTVTP